MNAYVINQGQLRQYIMIAIAALVLSFSFGYFVGSSQYGVDEPAAEKMPEATATANESSLTSANKIDDKTVIDKKDNDKQAAEKVTQKSTEKTEPKKNKKLEKKPIPKNKVVVKKPSKNTQNSKSVSKPAVIVKKAPVKRVEAVKKEPVKVVETLKKVTKAEPDNTEVLDTPDTTQQKNELFGSKRKYSIQAGMFASKNNAESFIEKLAVEKFEAHISDFVSTSGAIKYNVRVGRFEDRDKAREKLKDYQKFFSTPAYVVISQ